GRSGPGAPLRAPGGDAGRGTGHRVRDGARPGEVEPARVRRLAGRRQGAETEVLLEAAEVVLPRAQPHREPAVIVEPRDGQDRGHQLVAAHRLTRGIVESQYAHIPTPPQPTPFGVVE